MNNPVMLDLNNNYLNIGDEIIFANNGRLWKGKLIGVSGPTCHSCTVSIPELHGRITTLKLVKSREPRIITKTMQKNLDIIKSKRLMKV